MLTHSFQHGHLDFPPPKDAFFELPAGKPATAQISCDKGYTTNFKYQDWDIEPTDSACKGQPSQEFHANDINDVEGCALAITYKSDVSTVQPEDFAIFSVNTTCVWNLFTEFQVPAAMPACPPGGCICAFFWIHAVSLRGACLAPKFAPENPTLTLLLA